MKERPILFSAPMVRALLAGTKTQTRRIVKPQPVAGVRRSAIGTTYFEDGHGRPMRSLYGAPGDRLWVKETVRLDDGHMGRWPANPAATSYVADDAPCVIDTWPWKRRILPSIFLPRGASRITLEVTGVRAERLQAITEEDARAEGFPLPEPVACDWVVTDQTVTPPVTTRKRATVHFFSPLDAFVATWRQINGADSWEANPWVWVVEFKVLPR